MAVGRWSSSDKASSLLLLVISCAACASGTTYIVGDSSGWNLGVNYSTWTSDKTFVPGDALEFRYGSTHNVEEVNAGDYRACSSSNVISRNATGDTIIPLTEAGTRYFICGINDHCSRGMQLQVDVSASSTASPTPPASSAPPPTNNNNNNDNNNAGILSPVHAAAVVCVGLLAVGLGVF